MKVGQRFNPHRMFTGVFIPDAVYTYQQLSAAAKLIYGRLCKYKGERGEAYPSGTTLAAELGISERQAFDHLGRLVVEGFIEREARPGTSTVYHFLWHASFESDQEEEVVRKTALPKEGGSAENRTTGSAENRTGGSAENRIRRESVEESQLKRVTPPVVPQENLQENNAEPEIDTDEDVIAFLQSAYSRENRRAKLPNLRSRQAEQVIEKVRRADIEWGPQDFRLALIAYLKDSSDWLREHKWPIHTFLHQVAKYIPFSAPPAPPQRTASASCAAAPAEDAHQPPASVEGLKTDSGANVSPLPLAAQQWNQIVTAGPAVESWSPRHDRALDGVMADPEFQAALPKILALCKKAFEVQGDEVSWLNFRYVLRANKGGIPNWHRMASGEFNWMRKKRGPQSKLDEAKAAVARILGD